MRRVATALLAAALAGCGSHDVRYLNASDPAAGQAQFDRDKYECERESERPPSSAAESATGARVVIDPAQVESCLSQLGWHANGN